MGPPLANSKGKLSLAGQKTEVTEVTEEAPRHHHPIIAKSTLSALKKEKRSGRGREEVGKRSGRGREEVGDTFCKKAPSIMLRHVDKY